jgi:hypothetical protein
VENGATENEAIAAKEKAIKLALKYRLNANALGGRTKNQQSETGKAIRVKKNDLWIRILGSAMARKTETFFVDDRGWYLFFGTKQDVKLARPWFNCLYKRMNNACKQQKDQYKIGLAMKVAIRLLPNNPELISSIVPTREEIKDEFEQDNKCSLIRQPLLLDLNNNDFIKGYRDGDNINLELTEELQDISAEGCLTGSI